MSIKRADAGLVLSTQTQQAPQHHFQSRPLGLLLLDTNPARSSYCENAASAKSFSLMEICRFLIQWLSQGNKPFKGLPSRCLLRRLTRALRSYKEQVLWNNSWKESLNFGGIHVTGSKTELLGHATPPLWHTGSCDFYQPSIYDVAAKEEEQTHVSQATNCSAEITIGNSRSQEFAHRHWKIITSKLILSSLNLLGDKSGAEQTLYLTQTWFTKYSVPRSMQKALGCCECWLFYFLAVGFFGGFFFLLYIADKAIIIFLLRV